MQVLTQFDIKPLSYALLLALLSGCATVPVESSGPVASSEPIEPSELSQNKNTGPSYDCTSPSLSSIENLICHDATLAAMDRQLARIYAQALAKAQNQHPPVLKAEQRGFIKGRNDCWKGTDKKQCVIDNYQTRMVELQARYRLVESTGPVFYRCDNIPAKEVVITYFDTEPNSLIAEFGDSTSLMTIQPSGSGTRYQGRNEQFWEHHGQASITWGYKATPMQCTLIK